MAEQRFPGTTFFNAGGSRKTMSMDGIVLSASGQNLTTTGTAEQVVLTINLSQYGGLITSGTSPAKWLLLSFLGSTAANGNNKQIRVYQTSTSGTKIADSGAVAGNSVGWFVNTSIIPSAATTADAFGETQISSSGTCTYAQLTGLNFARGTGLTFVVSLTTATAAADMTLRAWQVTLVTEGGIQSASGVLL